MEGREDRLQYLERLARQQYLIHQEHQAYLARLEQLSNMMREDPLTHLYLTDRIAPPQSVSHVQTPTQPEATVETTEMEEVVVETMEMEKQMAKMETEIVMETELTEAEVSGIAVTAETVMAMVGTMGMETQVEELKPQVLIPKTETMEMETKVEALKVETETVSQVKKDLPKNKVLKKPLPER